MVTEPVVTEPNRPRARPVEGVHRFLSDFNNLLLIPVFSFVVVDLMTLAPDVRVQQLDELLWIEDAISICFFSEWLLGLALAPRRRAYLMSPLRIADLLSSLPLGFTLHSLRGLRVLRLLRLLRVLWRMRRLRGRMLELIRVSAAVTAVAVAGAVALHRLEPETVPTLSAALWWSIVTMSTVGYGDIAPVTDFGRAVAVVMITVGIAIFGYALSVVGGLWEPQEDATMTVLLRIEERLARIEEASAAKGEQRSDPPPR